MLGFLFSFVKGSYEDKQESKKYIFLSIILGLIVGIYWVLRILKDNVFFKVVGPNYQPAVKILSLALMIPTVILYSKLVDRFSRDKIFYFLGFFYGIAFLIFAIFIAHPKIGLPNTTPDAYRIIGWLWYVFVDSFGPVMVALFWSFAADITTSDSAKRGFPLIGLGAQLGGFLCVLFLCKPVKIYGAPLVTVVASLLIFVVIGLIKYFVTHVLKESSSGIKIREIGAAKETKAKLLDGLRMIISNPYLLGIFAVVSFYQVIVTMLDYQFKCLANDYFICHREFGAYLFNSALWINGIAIVCLLFGINTIGRRLGLGASLVVLPILMAAAVAILNTNLNLSVAFWIIVFCKAINYALNQPAKEQLYIPTTKEAKYKSKAWIDVFGVRLSKSAGSAVNLLKPVLGQSFFVMISFGLSFGIIIMWIFVSIFLGTLHSQAVKKNKAVC